MGLQKVLVSVTTTGADGSATGAGYTHIVGRVLAIYLDYHASAPNTTDVTVAHNSVPTENILTISNSATDAWYYTRKATCINDGTAQSNWEPYIAYDDVKVNVGGCNALTAAVVAHIYYEDLR